MVEGELFGTLLRLSLALLAGGVVGLERSYHGRPAGFREHTLVCISSCMLMLLAEYHVMHLSQVTHSEGFLDPTRMAQGIMTGIGFLGAGAIVKDGLSIRGLTTAASIWMIAAIGIMIGMGYYVAAIAAALATLNINYVFRLIEGRMRAEFYAHLHVRFARDQVMPEGALRSMLAEFDCSPTGMSYSLVGEGRWFEYHTQLKTFDKDALSNLSLRLNDTPGVVEFAVAPRGE